MSIYFVFINLLLMFNNNYDVEEIIGYNPKRVEIISSNHDEFLKIITELRTIENQYKSYLYIKPDTNFYWVLSTHGNNQKLFKYYGDLDSLENFLNDEPINRKVGYYYLYGNGTSHRVVTLTGIDAINSVLNYHKASVKSISFQDYNLIQLTESLYLYRDLNFINTCKIYSNLNDIKLDINSNGKAIGSLDNKVLNFKESSDYISEALNLRIDTKRLTKKDLDIIALKCFEFVKSDDLYKLYSSLCSVLLKYLLDNDYGEMKIDGGDVIVYNKNSSYNVNMIVLKTIDNIILYEYNPNLYFQLITDIE